MQARDFTAGQRITISGGRFNGNGKVLKVLQKNVDVVLDSGQRVRAHPSFLAPEGSTPAAALPEPDKFAVAPPTGSFVRFTGNDDRITGLFVVIGEGFQRGRTVAKIAKAGGVDNGRYWNVPAASVEVIDPAEVLA